MIDDREEMLRAIRAIVDMSKSLPRKSPDDRIGKLLWESLSSAIDVADSAVSSYEWGA